MENVYDLTNYEEKEAQAWKQSIPISNSDNERNYNNSSSFDRRNTYPDGYSQDENCRSNNNTIKNQGQRSFGQRSRGEQDNRNNNYSDQHLVKVNPPSEVIISTASSTNADYDESIGWNFSPTNRPSSPLFDFDREDDRMVPRRRSRCHEETSEDNNADFKGVNFLPPLPMVPVSLANNLPIKPKIPRIFENDSRSSAQSFDKLIEFSKVMWQSFEDVPLDLASREYVDSIEIPKGQNLLSPPEPRSGPCEKYDPESTSKHGSSSSESQDRSGEKNNSTRKPGGDFEGVRRQFHQLGVHRKLENIKTSQKTVETTPEKTVETTTTTVTSVYAETVSPKKKRKEKKDESKQVCDKVEGIFRTNCADWLNCILKAVDDLVPKIGLFDTEAIRKLLIILSSNIVLNSKNNKDAKLLIHMFIKEPNFFKKIFSYMKEEINCGCDFLPIIRLINFIVKLSPDAARQIPRDTINEVCTRVESTFTEAELVEVRQKLEDITEYRIAYHL